MAKYLDSKIILVLDFVSQTVWPIGLLINPTRSDLTLIHLVRQRLAQPHSYWCYRGVIEGMTFGRLIYRQTLTALSHDL